ncbi:hypothetical protein CPLU01_10160 [Colletotrichum plurivorum]|uniref:Uncharacterized protein n=1 Tax=Colletotrichum plurivorum TaxID=2175906 RepID=A0A8H6K712_9PEZI|nr:hypothetical protein CPLU01_10160 [Colletotrichum plurivorum]
MRKLPKYPYAIPDLAGTKLDKVEWLLEYGSDPLDLPRSRQGFTAMLCYIHWLLRGNLTSDEYENFGSYVREYENDNSLKVISVLAEDGGWGDNKRMRRKTAAAFGKLVCHMGGLNGFRLVEIPDNDSN